MKKVLLSLAAVTAIAAAASPAAAQRYDRYGSLQAADNQMNQRELSISRAIQRADSRGQISHRQAIDLKYEMGAIETREKAYRRSGGRLTMNEIADVHARLDRLEQRIQYVAANSRGRYQGDNRYGYGYGNGYGW